ncbi:MAG: glycosyltransferase family A protein [Bacteroidales bacterium]
MLLSIIIPAYNAESYLSRCIASIYNQDLITSDFEILLIENNSQDSTLECAQTLQKQYAKLSILQQKTQGVSASRNMGIRQAQGKFLLFVDADDYLLPHTLKNALRLADTQNLDLLYFAHQRNKGYILPTEQLRTLPRPKTGTEIYDLLPYTSSACTFLFNRSFLAHQAIYFNESIHIGEDALFVCQSLLYAQNVNIDPHCIYFYELNAHSSTAIVSKEKIFNQCENLSILLAWNLKAEGKNRELIQNLIALTLFQMLEQTAQIKRCTIYPQLRKKLKTIKAYPLQLDSLSRIPKGFHWYLQSIDLMFLYICIWRFYLHYIKPIWK